MSMIQTVQASSLSFQPEQMLSAFQSVAGETVTFHAFPSNQGLPVNVSGDGTTKNPVIVYDNRIRRATYLLAMFACTAANNAFMAVDATCFSQIKNPNATTAALVPTGIWVPTRMFNGIAQAGNISMATSTGEASSFLCDNFSTKTFASSFVSYIEPADDIGGAVLIFDMRGFDLAVIRLAQGGATAATKGQVYLGVN